jgi:biopolymer transport protein ExbB/TolQ
MEQIWHALRDGAPFSFVNVAVLAFVIAIIAERFVYLLTKYRVNSNEFMAQIRKLVQAGNIDRAIKLCEAAPLPLLQVVKSGLTQSQKGDDAVIAAMEEKWAELHPALEKRTPWLWTLANIATLIGLLGTISGLIKAFGAVGSADASQRAAILARGISEAMWNTALGLGIAVLCMIFHLILHTMTKNIKQDMELSTMKLENLLLNKGR